MNAPANSHTLQPEMQMIHVKRIYVSTTLTQHARRGHRNEQAMAELIESVRSVGILQPILVRPSDPGEYEIVAGERRYDAALAVSLKEVPCVVRTISDADAIAMQLTENLQREGLHELDEAQGYQELMQLQAVNADAVAEMVGKSRSYVYGRLKLLDLRDAARDAFYDGSLDASKALELARIKDPKKQAQLLAEAVKVDWTGSTMSVRDLKRTIEASGLVKPLAGAAFDPESDLLFRFLKARKGVDDTVMLPACTDCTRRAGDGSAADPYVCTDVACFDDKVKDTYRRKRLIAEGAGRTILTGDAARAMLQGNHAIGQVFVLDEACDFDDYPVAEPEEPEDDESPAYLEWNKKMDAWHKANDAHQPRTYRQLLGDAPALEPILVEDVKTKALLEVVPIKDAVKILEAKGIDVPHWVVPEPKVNHRPDQAQLREDALARAAQAEKDRVKLEAELAHRRAVLQAVHAKWKGPYKREDWLDVATVLWEGGDMSMALNSLYGDEKKDPPLGQMKEAELQRFILEMLICGCCDSHYASPHELFTFAKRNKIDPAQVKKDMAAAAKAKDKPAAVKAPAKKKATKK